jgi:two-component system, cell cycle sensor histidine kinase and response regulator CckA
MLTRAGLLLAVTVFLLSALSFGTTTRVSVGIERASYDWLFDLTRWAQPNMKDSDVVIIYLDEESHHDLNQPFNQAWDRALHAQLLDRLTEEAARLVVFDIIFSDPGPNAAKDEVFRRALERNGNVVLAADYRPSSPADGGDVAIIPKRLTSPYEPFLNAAAGWGVAQLHPDHDFVVRRHYHTDQRGSYPSLTWKAATLLGALKPGGEADPLRERWIKYYGGPETMRSVSYRHALSAGMLRPGFFRDKIVFVGARPMTGFYNERRDELRSPYSVTGLDFQFMPAVEFHAVQLLNLLRQDWLQRLPPVWEYAIMALVALAASLGLVRLRPVHAVGVGVLGAFLTLALVMVVFLSTNVWFAWLPAMLVPLALSLMGALLYRTHEWYVIRRELQARERQARARIAEQAALLDKAHDAIIVHDFNWRITFWNQGAEATYGWPAAEALGRDIRELLVKEDAAKYEPARETLLIEGEWQGELQHHHRSDRKLTISSRWSLVRDEQGQPKSVLLINTDVTEQRELEAQFLRTQRMESIGTLAGGIAHDLNNVLAPIMMGIELVRMRVKDEKTDSTLARMAGSAQRGADLVKQVLTFARGHEGERLPIQLSHLIKEMQKIVQETFPRNIDIKTREDAHLPPILADATQVHQILLNLCVNARDAMPDGGGILITANRVAVADGSPERGLGLKCGEFVKLSVSDTGTGIPPEIREKIFEPFFTTKEIGKGTGLGLSTVNTIVRNHGGALELLSEPGQGTTFNIYLPVAVGAVTQTELELPDDALRGHGEVILIVDDEAAIRELAQSALLEFGYQVHTAGNGAEALELAGGMPGDIALLVTDIMMPVMDGTRLIKTMRSRQPGLPIIAMSGLLESGDVKRRQLLTDVRFLAKPFDARRLVLAVHQLLERQRTTQTEEPDRFGEDFPAGESGSSRGPAARNALLSVQSGSRPD